VTPRLFLFNYPKKPLTKRAVSIAVSLRYHSRTGYHFSLVGWRYLCHFPPNSPLPEPNGAIFLGSHLTFDFEQTVPHKGSSGKIRT
jgi:hypothetical protein